MQMQYFYYCPLENKKVQEGVVSEETANGWKSLRSPELPPGIWPVVQNPYYLCTLRNQTTCSGEGGTSVLEANPWKLKHDCTVKRGKCKNLSAGQDTPSLLIEFTTLRELKGRVAFMAPPITNLSKHNFSLIMLQKPGALQIKGLRSHHMIA